MFFFLILINTRSTSSASPVPCSSRPSAFVYSLVRSVSFILHFWGGEKPKICLHSGKPNIFSLDSSILEKNENKNTPASSKSKYYPAHYSSQLKNCLSLWNLNRFLPTLSFLKGQQGHAREINHLFERKISKRKPHFSPWALLLCLHSLSCGYTLRQAYLNWTLPNINISSSSPCTCKQTHPLSPPSSSD